MDNPQLVTRALVTAVVRRIATVRGMPQPWDLTMVVDAVGSDSCRARPRVVHHDRTPHLVVRAGPLTVFALDAGAVTDLASAWAAAHVRGAHLLPAELPQRTRPAREAAGAVFPVADVVVEGRQRWNVRPPDRLQRFLEVGTGSVTVRVHDRVALDTQVRAWAEASAFGIRIFGRSRVPAFGALLEQQRIRAVREAAAQHDRGLDSGAGYRG